MAQATLLLPARTRLVGQALPDDVARALGRSDRSDADAGERAQLRRQFQLVPDHWPIARIALTGQGRDGPVVWHQLELPPQLRALAGIGVAAIAAAQRPRHIVG